jgi:hypothetical protein
MDRDVELEHLRKADADIADARERVARQVRLIARIEDAGRDTATARSLLETMRRTLTAMETNRRIILGALDIA